MVTGRYIHEEGREGERNAGTHVPDRKRKIILHSKHILISFDLYNLL